MARTKITAETRYRVSGGGTLFPTFDKAREECACRMGQTLENVLNVAGATIISRADLLKVVEWLHATPHWRDKLRDALDYPQEPENEDD